MHALKNQRRGNGTEEKQINNKLQQFYAVYYFQSGFGEKLSRKN
jgi:hypothetical protein